MMTDGRIADSYGNSKWITGEDSREYVHELRRRHAAVAIGRSTLECDNPQLTVRHKSGFNPARIVFSNDPELPLDCFFVQNAKIARTIVVLRDKIAGQIENDTRGIEYWCLGKTRRSCQLKVFLKMAFDNNISSIFLEGGQRVASEFLESGLVNKLYLFYGNRLVGNGKNGVQYKHGLHMSQAVTLENRQFMSFDKDIMISGKPVYLQDALSTI